MDEFIDRSEQASGSRVFLSHVYANTVCIYIYIYICIYTHIYIYIYNTLTICTSCTYVPSAGAWGSHVSNNNNIDSNNNKVTIHQQYARRLGRSRQVRAGSNVASGGQLHAGRARDYY